jgi:hypothetical protein
MHEQFPFGIPLDLRNVVRDIVDQLHPQLLRRRSKYRGEGFADLMGDDLPVGKGRIRRTIHRGKLLLPLRRPKRRASQLLVLDGNSIAPHGLLEHLEIIAGHLVAESA